MRVASKTGHGAAVPRRESFSQFLSLITRLHLALMVFLPAVLRIGPSGLVVSLGLFSILTTAHAQQLSTETWPKGTLVSSFSDGGRINTFHNGYLYLGGLARTTVYDIRDPANPILANAWDIGANGHFWFKIGNLFGREYTNPVVQGSGFAFADLSALPAITPWTGPAPSSVADLKAFPYRYEPWNNNRIIDQRTGQQVGVFNFDATNGIGNPFNFRVGNLWFFVSETPNSGLSVFDFGDPANVRLLDILEGDYFQYTTFVGVWRNYIVLASGEDISIGGNNLIAINFSDPSNLTYEFGFPISAVTDARYVYFQDEFGFMAKRNRAVKINMEQRTVEELPISVPPGELLDDFQVMPLGHLLVVSGSEAGSEDDTFIYTHQDQLDTNAPYVGYHVPNDGAINQPVSTTIGLVVNDTLDDVTVNASNISIRGFVNGLPSGAPLPVDVISSQQGVINVTPQTPLAADTTYEVRVIGAGIRDVAGNGIEEYAFNFSTGATVFSDLGPDITNVSINGGQPVEGQTITFNASATSSTGTVEYRWQFGDESSETPWSTNGSAVYTYTEPGQYTVLLQARALGPDSRLYTSARSISVVVASQFPAPTREMRSTPIIIDSTARIAWNVNPDSDTVAVIDVDQATLTREISACRRPVSVALDALGRAWVSCQDSDEIRVLTSGGSTVQQIALDRGARPSGILASPDGSEMYVAEYAAGRVRRFDTTTFSETGVVDVGPTPDAMLLTGAGRLHVSRFISGASEGQVYVVETNGPLTAASPITLILDTTSVDNGDSGRGLPNYIAGLASEPGDQAIWYVGKKDNILRGLARDGSGLTHESTVRPLFGKIDAMAAAEIVGDRIDVDDSTLPSSIIVSPLGAHIFVTLAGNNRVSALDARSGEEVLSVDVGLAPEGIAIDAATNRILVQNFMSRSVTILDGDAFMTTANPALPEIATITTVANELLSAEELRGKQVFYNAADTRMALEGYITCASCHLGGGSDGRVWDFSNLGEGFRRTISLRGRGGMDQGRVHWTGNFDEIQDFEIPIRALFGGSGFIPNLNFSSNPLGAPNAGRSADMDALATYVASLTEVAPSPFRAGNGSLTAAGSRGKNLFQQQNCADCHNGPAFTDSARQVLHDVGTMKGTSGSRLGSTLTGLDTPTLMGLWENNSFFHDGSAATIMEVLTDISAAQHGGLNTLSGSELQDLEAYLLQIDGDEPAPETRPEPPTNVSVR